METSNIEFLEAVEKHYEMQRSRHKERQLYLDDFSKTNSSLMYEEVIVEEMRI